jgi:2,3-diketo-5-methylthio-1-phosphopentane phosphatase
METKKILLILDLDNTILSETTDYKVFKLLSETNLKKAIQPCENWALHMQKIYQIMKEENISLEEIKKTVLSIPLTEGFHELFDFIRQNKSNFEILIVSGANTLYIQWIIECYELNELIDGYYSNPAEPHEDFLIQIRPSHDHECPNCAIDQAQCKKKVLQEHFALKDIDYQIEYSSVLYIGDGENDFCPSTLLEHKHHLFPRENYALHKMIFVEDYGKKLKCNIHPWKSGLKIVEVLKKMI